MRVVNLLLTGSVLSAASGLALTPDALMCELLAKPGLVAVADATPEFS